MKRKQFNMKIDFSQGSNCMVKIGDLDVSESQSELEYSTRDGESPVTRRSRDAVSSSPILESCSLGMLHQLGGSLLLKLNMDWKPIANK